MSWQGDINRLDSLLEALEERLRNTTDKAQDLAAQLTEIRRQSSEPALLVDVLGRVLVQKNVCTREELARLIQSVDAEDGTPDGRRTEPEPPPETQVGGACRHQNSLMSEKCIYCGRPLGPET